MPLKSELREPEPAIVSALYGKMPSDAISLFNGEDLSAWQSLDGGDVSWYVKCGSFAVKPASGVIKTK
jgi:hypothetical protein